MKKKITKRKTKEVAQACNAANLRGVLWETLLNVKASKQSVKEANAVVSASRAICTVVKLELDAQKLSGVKSKRVNAFLAK